jgi:hypothetical protein
MSLVPVPDAPIVELEPEAPRALEPLLMSDDEEPLVPELRLDRVDPPVPLLLLMPLLEPVPVVPVPEVPPVAAPLVPPAPVEPPAPPAPLVPCAMARPIAETSATAVARVARFFLVAFMVISFGWWNITGCYRPLSSLERERAKDVGDWRGPL